MEAQKLRDLADEHEKAQRVAQGILGSLDLSFEGAAQHERNVIRGLRVGAATIEAVERNDLWAAGVVHGFSLAAAVLQDIWPRMKQSILLAREGDRNRQLFLELAQATLITAAGLIGVRQREFEIERGIGKEPKE